MVLSASAYQAAVQARKALKIAACPQAAAAGMKTLEDAGWDGDYVVPNQLSSRSLEGPVIILNNWFGWSDLDALDAPKAQRLRHVGYLEGIPTNRWLDRALEMTGLSRSDVYITQACVFLPPNAMGSKIPNACYALSANRILKQELGGRIPVALGGAAQKTCDLMDIRFVGAHHPSYQGGERRASDISLALKQVL